MNSYDDIDNEIARLQALKLERKAAQEEIKSFNNSVGNLHPRLQFYNCNKIEIFESLVKKYGKEYHPKQLYDKLIDVDTSGVEGSSEKQSIIFCCQLLVGGYFDDNMFIRREYDRCHQFMYGKELLVKLLNMNDLERIKMATDYIIFAYAKKVNLKLLINSYKNLTTYESNAIAQITKEVNTSKITEYFNSYCSLSNISEEIFKELLNNLHFDIPIDIIEYVLAQYTKPNPQENRQQKVLNLREYPSLNRILLGAVRTKNDKYIYLLKNFIDFKHPSFNPKEIIRALTSTNDIEWLDKILTLLDVNINYLRADVFCFDDGNCIVDFKTVTLEMYKKFFKLIGPENFGGSDSGRYKLIKYCYDVNRKDLAEFIIVNLPLPKI